jgi:predicted anti-sigma-YlaC factor YlaD
MSEPRAHITCQEVVDLVNGFLEGGLEATTTALFEQHLNFCEGCVSYVDQLRTTVATVGRIEEEDVPPEARAKLMAAFREWKRS